MTSLVPSALLAPGTSRQRLDCGLTSVVPWARQVCAPVPLQVQSWTRVPLAVPLLVTSRHLPSAVRLPLVFTVHFCALVPLQVYSWMGVPSAVPLLRMSTHLPARPVIGPVRPGGGVVVGGVVVGGVPPSAVVIAEA